MSTKNHKAATTSDIIPGTQSSEVHLTKEDRPSNTAPSEEGRPINPPIQKSNNPFSAATRARCGKVAST
jgi:hypothetical protein